MRLRTLQDKWWGHGMELVLQSEFRGVRMVSIPVMVAFHVLSSFLINTVRGSKHVQ